VTEGAAMTPIGEAHFIAVAWGQHPSLLAQEALRQWLAAWTLLYSERKSKCAGTLNSMFLRRCLLSY
jgi:hypothetical protein